MNFKKFLSTTVLAVVISLPTFANTDPNNDKKEKEDDTIVSVAASNENFTTLVAAVKAAGLVETLNSDGPFTVFAPVNDAFGKLPKGTVADLLKPENKKLLTAILTYHVVAGEFKAKDVLAAIKANNGKFDIKTVQGGTLTAKLYKGSVVLKDEKGNKSKVIITDGKTPLLIETED